MEGQLSRKSAQL